ncbi:uncharacterized protein FA14DRAFT_187571 [Meira miltonrushii]|uniref:Ubiquitin-like domain-containing protein n=1 Tax=Meira miltonrushii TaxID=1280837 RepID=A0A316VII1_9BASI|nr:uncharacterized protein FA14DRAFT_187571 [Meira miltonrushii]PWN37467.1 hypothetical protein FA14DRAFT_187571 [Meira miltonrushii]
MNTAAYIPVGTPGPSMMQVPPSPSVGPSIAAEHQNPRLIPIHVRLVPKDMWIRMHVDTRSTIGSVKDALLEKLQIPSYDPSLNHFFYEDARAAMSRQNATQADVKSFPKAFVARMPKRNAKEIRRAEREAEAAASSNPSSIHTPSSKLSKSLNIRKIPTIKQVSTSAQARAILGGDAGVGGRGSMGFIGNNVEAKDGKESKRGTKNKLYHTQRPKVIGPTTRARVISTQTAFSSSSDLAHPLSNSINASSSTPIKTTVRIRTEQQNGADDTAFDLTRAAGLDAYADYYGFGLSGNEEAKRLEEAAMIKLRAMDTTLAEGSLGDSHAFSSSPAKSSPSYADRTRYDDDDDNDEPLDGQQAFDELVQYSGSATHSTSTPITEESTSQLEQNTNSLVRRLAGINTDEISSWKDARHPQAKYYAVHSYSNGYIMEDWRTLAALRIRPFELLEIQYSDPHEKVHLPRLGEANDASSGKLDNRSQAKEREENNTPTQSPMIGEYDRQSNVPYPALDNRYLEPFAEAWCYIFKRGGGTSKAQKAGLGLWKLRWISLRGRNLTVYRTKYLRQGYDEAMNIWNLNSVESVISERADGATRPVLMPINGQCQDILTLTFARATVIPNSIHDESSDFQQATLSMRFITQHQDPFRAAMVFEWRRKAMARSVIAGLGGTVVPGKAGRRGGRNALSRKRLRPSGMSRDFDDADRWSSDSDGEDIPATQTASQQNIVGGVKLDADITSETFGSRGSPASTEHNAQFVPEGEEQSPAAQAIHSFLAQRKSFFRVHMFL